MDQILFDHSFCVYIMLFIWRIGYIAATSNDRFDVFN